MEKRRRRCGCKIAKTTPGKMNKSMKMIKYVAVLAGLGAAVSVAQAQNLLVNGSFETGDLTGWSASGVVGAASYAGATDGIYSAIFNWGDLPPTGVLSQSFATTPGDVYDLAFDYGTFGYAGVTGQTLFVDVNGSSTLLNTFATSPTGGDPTPFELFTFNFTANSATTTLQFTDNPDNNTIGNDGVLDKVSVTADAVPDGASTAMLCGMSLLALGWLRRKLA